MNFTRVYLCIYLYQAASNFQKVTADMRMKAQTFVTAINNFAKTSTQYVYSILYIIYVSNNLKTYKYMYNVYIYIQLPRNY